MKAMVSVTDKLASVSEALKSEEVSLKEVGTMLASAGKEIKTVDKSVMESIEVVEEYEFVSETLTEFVEMEAEGMFETEELAADSIVEQEELIEMCDKYESALEVKVTVDQEARKK